MSSRRSILWALIILLVVGTGCFVGRPDDGDSGTSGQRGREVTPANPDEFAEDLRSATNSAEGYWETHFAAAGRRFDGINRIIAYRRSGEVECGDQPLGRNNAAYCSAGDFIAYDVNWAAAAFDQLGDAFLYYLLGHEYAHHIQVVLGLQYRFTIQQELQADCMAGAYLGDSVRQGQLLLEDGDLEELRNGLVAVADDPDQPWFAEGSHGSAEQRTNAFFAGYRGSLGPCDLPL